MSLNLIAVHDQIATKLRELPQDVYETSAPDDAKLKHDGNGNLLPYIVVEFSDMYASNSGKGITGAKYNVGQSFIVVTCVSTNQRACRQVADAVREKLTGFIPSDAGELVPSGGTVQYSNPDAKPNRYVAEVGFTFAVNTAW